MKGDFVVIQFIFGGRIQFGEGFIIVFGVKNRIVFEVVQVGLFLGNDVWIFFFEEVNFFFLSKCNRCLKLGGVVCFFGELFQQEFYVVICVFLRIGVMGGEYFGFVVQCRNY